MKRSSHLLPSAALLMAGLIAGCAHRGAAPTTSASVPATGDLLRNVAQATQTLGPCTITVGTLIQRPGRDTISATDTIYYNDATHYKDASQMGEDTSVAYAGDGTREFIFTPRTKEYTVGDAGDSLPGLLSNFPDVFRSGLDNPKRSAALTAAKVTASTLNGTPTYEITWDKPLPGMVVSSDTARITMTVGQQDYLPRKLVQQDEKGLNSVTTAEYQKENAPFPAKEVTFTPPVGAKRTGTDYHALAQAFAGKKASDFALSTLDGKKIQLADLRGKWVLLDFWATWCPPCRASLPFTNEAAETFGPKGLQVLALDQGSKREKIPQVKDFVQRHGYTFTVLRDEGAKTAKNYQVPGIPTSVLVDPNGIIRNYEVGFRSEKAFWDTLARAGFKA